MARRVRGIEAELDAAKEAEVTKAFEVQDTQSDEEVYNNFESKVTEENAYKIKDIKEALEDGTLIIAAENAIAALANGEVINIVTEKDLMKGQTTEDPLQEIFYRLDKLEQRIVALLDDLPRRILEGKRSKRQRRSLLPAGKD